MVTCDQKVMQTADGVVACCPFAVTVAAKRAGGLCQRPVFWDLTHTVFPVLTTVPGPGGDCPPHAPPFMGDPGVSQELS